MLYSKFYRAELFLDFDNKLLLFKSITKVLPKPKKLILMSALAIILKAESTPDNRTIAYETYRKQTVITVQQDYQLDEWVTVNHMALPIVIFDFIQSFRFGKGLMKGVQYLRDFVTS